MSCTWAGVGGSSLWRAIWPGPLPLLRVVIPVMLGKWQFLWSNILSRQITFITRLTCQETKILFSVLNIAHVLIGFSDNREHLVAKDTMYDIKIWDNFKLQCRRCQTSLTNNRLIKLRRCDSETIDWLLIGLLQGDQVQL